MRKLDLVNSIEDRNEVMTVENETKVLDVLRRLGDVVDYMTEPMVAEFYGVNKEAITSIGRRNKEELSDYGYKVYSKSEIKNTLNGQLDHLENIPNRGLRLYPIKAVLIIGMMLTESEMAEKLRSEIIKELFSNNTPVTDIDLQKGLALLKVAEGKTMEERINGATEYARITTLALEEEKKQLESTLIDIVDTNMSYETLRRELKANIDFLCRTRGDFRTPWLEFYKFLFENGYNLKGRMTRAEKRVHEQINILGEQIENLKENVIYELEKEIKNYKRNTIEYKVVREQINKAKDEVKKLQAENRKLLSEFNNSNKLDYIKEEEWGEVVVITRSWLKANGIDWREGLSRDNNLPF